MFFPCISSKWAVWRLRERKEKEPPSASQLIISWSACPHSPHNPIFQTLDLCISYSDILVFCDMVICISGPQSPYSTQFFKFKVFIFIFITPSTSLFLQKITRKSTHRCASLLDYLDYLDDLGYHDYRYYLDYLDHLSIDQRSSLSWLSWWSWFSQLSCLSWWFWLSWLFWFSGLCLLYWLSWLSSIIVSLVSFVLLDFLNIWKMVSNPLTTSNQEMLARLAPKSGKKS